jgi:hypothetical protein
MRQYKTHPSIVFGHKHLMKIMSTQKYIFSLHEKAFVRGGMIFILYLASHWPSPF